MILSAGPVNSYQMFCVTLFVFFVTLRLQRHRQKVNFWFFSVHACLSKTGMAEALSRNFPSLSLELCLEFWKKEWRQTFLPAAQILSFCFRLFFSSADFLVS